MSIHYVIRPIEPDAHLFEVQLEVACPDPAGQLLSLPNWIPGSYMIRDFSRNVVSIEARGGSGETVVLERVDKSRWRAPAKLPALSLTYRVYAWELSVRAAYLDRQRGFFNGTSVFLAVEGQTAAPLTVDIQPPPLANACWEVATALTAERIDEAGFGRYVARDYDELIDHPVQLGRLERHCFEAGGIAHELVFSGRQHTDGARIAGDLKRITEQQIDFFGALPPLRRYVFLVTVVDEGYGGLEHRASTALMIGRNTLPVPNASGIDDDYLEFLGLCSHEYFHTWNVKRVRPAAFVPYKLDSEQYTRLLWWFEGVTSYYDDLFLARAGLIDAERYLGLLAKTITRVRRTPGRLLQSVTESSFDAWHKFYKQDANAANAIVSYYSKGALVALCLDAVMRRASEGASSLDALMQRLWQDWLQVGDEAYRGIDETAPERLATELSGTDLSTFFHTVLYEPGDLPLDASLEALGVKLHWRRRQGVSDAGGERSDDKPVAPWLGASVTAADGGVRVSSVTRNSPAEAAGLAPGDTLIAIARQSVTVGGIDRLLLRIARSSPVELHYFRHGELCETRLYLELPPADTATLSVHDQGKMDQWLQGAS